MQIITAPIATVVSRPQFVPHPTYRIPDDGDDATKLGSFAAKGCYDSFGANGRPNEANQHAILEHAHGSVTEHMHYSLFLEGITRGLSLELNRHRPFNISQRSTRYTKEDDAAIVLDPYYSTIYIQIKDRIIWDDGRGDWERGYRINDTAPVSNSKEILTLLHFLDAARDSIEAYTFQVQLLEELNPRKLTGFDLRKWARGKARNLLPHGLETRGTWTNNIRGWRWFIESRSITGAEPEIRVLADVILQTLRKEAPLYFEDFQCVDTYDSIPVWSPTYRKV